MSRTTQYRLGIAVRTVGAIGGGYALAAAVCVALAKLLPMAPSEATVTATMAGVLAMPAAILWMFAVSSAARAWAGLLICLLLCTLADWFTP